MFKQISKIALSCIFLSACSQGNGTANAGDQSQPAISFKNSRQVFPNLYVGGQPSKEELQSIKEAGVQVLINVRTLEEPGQENMANISAEMGFEYVSIPVAGKAGVTIANAEKLRDALGSAGDRTTALFCGSGNRAAALLAMKAFHLENQTAEQAMALGDRAGLTKLKDYVHSTMKK
jgi:uncharacterized protein (TIGR01244 family)